MTVAMQGKMKDQSERSCSGIDNWHVTKEARPYIEVFQDRKADLVYLTGDADDELQELDKSKLYIIGGLVDRNRHKGICWNKAQTQVGSVSLCILDRSCMELH